MMTTKSELEKRLKEERRRADKLQNSIDLWRRKHPILDIISIISTSTGISSVVIILIIVYALKSGKIDLSGIITNDIKTNIIEKIK